MTFADQFSVVDEAIAPQPWMQLRQVGSVSTPGVSKSYDVSDGSAKNDAVQSLKLSWTNNTPVAQWVYGMVTRGGSQVTLQARSRAYLAQYHGANISADPTTIQLYEVSQFGVGTDIGLGGMLATGTSFGVAEVRENTTTIPLLPHVTGWFYVAPGQQFNAQVGVAFVSDYWESTAIDGGNSGSESKFIAGELRLDLFALPGVDPPPPRANPLIVGGGANITHDTNINWGSGTMTTSPAVPAGVMAGDFLLAIVANNFGESTEINPVETGWTLAHSRNDGVSGDVHMKMYLREATSSEPAHYNFTNGFLAESITMMVALRNVPAFEGDEGSAWYIASNLSTWQWVETQIAPSIQRAGQLLLAVSYFTIASWQAPIHQTVPPGMTSLIDQSETVSTMAIASLANPPNPTADRQFTPSAVPQFSGHSITASILVPGNQII